MTQHGRDELECHANREGDELAMDGGVCATRNIDPPRDETRDWSDLGRIVLTEAVRRATDELLRREEMLRNVRQGRPHMFRGEVLS